MVKSRRDFVIGAGTAMAAAGLVAACHGPGGSLPGGTTAAEGLLNRRAATAPYDVVVIGAGAAGIGAARQVLSYGRSVLLLEAQGRAGGRAITDNTTFSEVGFDLGAQFFGHVLSGNVLFGIAQQRGMHLVDFSTLPTAFYYGAKRAPLAESASFVATAGGMISDILLAGVSIARSSADVPVSHVIAKYKSDKYYQNAIGVTVTTESGAEPEESSTLDLFNFMVGSPSPFLTPGDSYVFKSGMGNFVQSLANGLPVRTNVSVNRITRDSNGVSIETNAGTFTAKTAIVTVSPAVLAAGGIEFAPALPTATTDAIAALPLGVVYKAALGFATDFCPQFNGMTAVTQLAERPAITYFAKFWNTNIVEILADAALAKRIEAMSRTQQIEFLLGRLELNFPGAAAAFDGRFTASNWGRNQFTHGSYSRALVGMTEARSALRKSVDKQIFFAGEAVAQTSTITLLQGAYNSGIAAATGALRAIGVPAAVPA